MKYLTLKTRLLALLLLAATCAAAQPTPAQLASRPELTASIYHSYEYLPGPAAPVPDGYEPFYISHYGRHGSRYHSKEEAYAEPLAALRKADKAGALTPKGREVLAKVRRWPPMPANAAATFRPAAYRNTAASPSGCSPPIPGFSRPTGAACAVSRAARRRFRAVS